MITAAKSESESMTLNVTLIRFILFWCALMVVSSVYVTTPLLTTLAKEFQVTQEMASWASSSFSLFYAIGFLFFGPISDRFGTKQVIVFGLAVLSIVTLILGFTVDFTLFVTLRGVQGFFASTFAPTALSYVFSIFSKDKRVTTIGLISFGYVLSGLFGQIIADLINRLFHFHMIFLLFGALYIFSLFLVYVSLPRASKTVSRIDLKQYFKQIKQVLTKRNILSCYLITFLLLLTFLGMYTGLGDFLDSPQMRLQKVNVSTVRIFGIIGMVLSPFASFFVQRIGVLKLLQGSLAMSVTGLLLLGIGGNAAFITIMSVLYVAGISLIFPVIMVLIGELGGENRATAASLYAFILFIGATLGPMVALTLMRTGNYLLTFGGLGALLGIGLIVSFWIKLK